MGEEIESTVKIIDLKFEKLDNPIVVEGFPSVGLVGAIATEYLTSKLKMKYIGYMKSKRFPPITLIKDGIPTAPIRIYAKDNLVVFVSDTAVPPAMVHDVADCIVNWVQKHQAKQIVSIGGIAQSARQQEDKPNVYGVATTAREMKKIENAGLETIHLGFLTGVYGVLMMECAERGIPAMGFLADAHYEYPDPAAAAAALDAMAKVLKLKISTKPLLETADRIESKMQTLMSQTKKAMDGMESQQYPSIYR